MIEPYIIMELIYGILEQGLIYGLVGLAIFLTFRITDFPDMGVNNSFTFGAAIWFLVVKAGWSPLVGVFCAFLGGALVGYITAAFHLFFHIKHLLAGIITMIGLYSINIRLMGGPNIPLIHIASLFPGSPLQDLIILASIVALVAGLLIVFLLSDFGLGLRISGNNPLLGETYGISKNIAIGTLVSVSNGIVALSGALLAQLQGFLDLNMGAGILIIGLISVMLGEKVFSTKKLAFLVLLSVLGAVLYKIAVFLALYSSDLGLKSSDLYLVTALMMVVILYMR